MRASSAALSFLFLLGFDLADLAFADFEAVVFFDEVA
jgi:hypothetical protein